jgi:ketosteroid isomerase-like protein
MPDHLGETYRGFEGYRRAVATFTEPFEEMIYDLERIVGAGDRAVSMHGVRATARHTGIRFDLQAAYVLSFRGGRIAQIQGFLDPDQALKAVGLEE